MMFDKLSAVILSATVLLLAACFVGSHEVTGPTEHLQRSVEMDKSASARLELKMGAGKINLRGGSANLMDADITYNVPSWKPDIRYTNSSTVSDISIEQPSGSQSALGDHEYTWDLKLNDDKPLSLDVKFGAGECNLNMGSLTLENLDVKMGVGELKLDLRGTPKKDYQVQIHGGVGEATVYLPEKVGIVANASGGLGEVDAKGLHKRGDRYVNDAYENNAKVAVRLDIKGGIGAIHLIGQ